MKSASTAVTKWQQRASMSASDYGAGAQATEKDQSARAIAAKANYAAGIQESITAGRYEKGLAKSGKQGWLDGVQEKGVQNYGTGVSADRSRNKYLENSGKFDNARKAADSLPRGPRGSAQNLNRVTVVANALRAAKVGK